MSAEDHKQALPAGFQLGAYHVVRVLGVGGFGVTYLCEHSGLGVQVAVKEYLPNEIAVRDGTEVHPKSAGDREGFEWGLSRFLDEARTLARFEHPNVVRVRDCFEANNTAYIVMDYEDGEPLDALLRRHGTLTEAQLKRVVLPVADGLRQVHAAEFLHRDIKPSNIFVRRSDESPVLLDFGSARQALGRRSRSVTAIASAGYSPPEQYESDGAQGAWTDIYALSALCYRAITGDAPIEATKRQSRLLRTQTDPLPKLAEVAAAGYSPAFLEAVDWGLDLIETERPQSLHEWLPMLERASTPSPAGSKLKQKGSQPASSPPTHRTDEQEASRRGSKVVWLVAGFGLLLIIGLVWFAIWYRSADPKVGERFRDCAKCPEMIVVPAGSFLMGSRESEGGRAANEGRWDRSPVKWPFALGVYEVTVAEYSRFVAETGYSAPGSCWRLFEEGSAPGWRSPGFDQNGRHPVVCVSWHDARAYAAWLSRETGKEYRLPSESEWEYAARAGTAMVRYWDEKSDYCRYANGEDASMQERYTDLSGASCRDGYVYTAPVGSFVPNGWGLHDMLGNVMEWTGDCYGVGGILVDGRTWEYANCSRAILRGGSWDARPREFDTRWSRRGGSIGGRTNLNGFRVARTFVP